MQPRSLGRDAFSVLRPFPSRFLCSFSTLSPSLALHLTLCFIFGLTLRGDGPITHLRPKSRGLSADSGLFDVANAARGISLVFWLAKVGRVQSSDNLGGLAKIQLGELSPSSLALRNVCLSLSSSQSSIPLHFIMNMSSYLPFSTWAKRGEKI